MCLGAIDLAGGLPGALAGMIGIHLGRADLATEYHLARLRAHGANYSAPCRAAQCRQDLRREPVQGPIGSVNVQSL
jgi:hypothetical protein